MNLESAVIKFGESKVSKSIFPKLEGVIFEKILFDGDSKIETPKLFFETNNTNEWFLGSGNSPLLYSFYSIGDREPVLKSLLIANNISFESKQINSSDNEDCFWLGNGFRIEALSILDKELIFIKKEDVLASKESMYLETNLAQKINNINWILGLETIYDAKSIDQPNKSLHLFLNTPLLFREENSEYILIPVENNLLAEALILRIIKDNGGKDSFVYHENIQKRDWNNFHSGPLFSIGYLDKSKVVRINRNSPLISKKENESLESGIHKISDILKNEIEGFDSLIYNPKEGGVCDGRFYAKTNEAINITSLWIDPVKAIKTLKKIVNAYNPKDDFLRLKDSSIIEWMNENESNSISFNIPNKCNFKLKKEISFYQLDIYPPNGIRNSWENLKKGNYKGETPVVTFSTNIKTKNVLPEIKPKVETIQKPLASMETPSKIETNNKTLDFLESNIDSNTGNSNNRTNFKKILKWLLIIVCLILFIMIFKNCENSVDKDKVYYYNKGISYSNSGDIEKASENFEKAIEMDAFYVAPYIKRGEMYLKYEMYNEAKYDFNQAVTYDNNNWRVHYLRGRANIGLGRSKYSKSFKNAVQDFSTSISLNSSEENAYSYFYRATVLKIQESDAACDDFYKACEFNITEACEIVDSDCYPKTGFMPYNKNFGPGVFTGDRDFEIDNINGDTDLVANLISVSTKRKVRSQFVRKGETLVMHNVPKDKYILKYFEGNQWSTNLIMDDNITKGGFLKISKFSVVKKAFNFSGYKMRGVGFGVSGDLESEDISEKDFFN